MESKTSKLLGLKDKILNVLKYCQNYDLLSLELTNSTIRNRVIQYYSKMVQPSRPLNTKLTRKEEFDTKVSCLSKYLNEVKIVSYSNFKFDSFYEASATPLSNYSLAKSGVFEHDDINSSHAKDTHLQDKTFNNCLILQTLMADNLIFVLSQDNILQILLYDQIRSIEKERFRLKVDEENENAVRIAYHQEFQILFYITNNQNLYYTYQNQKGHFTEGERITTFIEEEQFIKCSQIYLIKNFVLLFSEELELFYLCRNESLLPLVSFRIVDEDSSNQTAFKEPVHERLIEEESKEECYDENDLAMMTRVNQQTEEANKINYLSSKYSRYLRFEQLKKPYPGIRRISFSKNGVMFIDTNNKVS